MPVPVHRNITQTIVQTLGVDIVAGRYVTATFPNEKDLAEKFGAARSVTREAVKMLTSKGLIRSKPRTGISIEPRENWNLLDSDVLSWMLARGYSHKTLVEFTEFRLGIEPNAARLAAQNATQHHKTAIAAAIARMYAAEQKDDDSLASDIAFHVAVLNGTGNPFYLGMRDFIVTALTFSIRRTHPFDPPKMSALFHDRVAKAIYAGDSVKAEKAMRALIDHALELIGINDDADQITRDRA